MVFKATGHAVPERADAGGLVGPGVAYVEATGHGLPAPSATGPLQERMTAVEAARCRALAHLAEKMEGLTVQRESQVVNFQFAGESVQSRTQAELPGATMVAQEFDETSGMARVTLRLPLDATGRPVEAARMLPAAENAEARRARCERAARVEALANLREQVGRVQVGKYVQVKDLVLARQEAWSAVEGILRGVDFSEPQWQGEACTVQAELKVSREELEQLAK